MALDDGGGDVAELAAVVLGVVAQHLEGPVGVDRVAGHQDPLRLLDQRPTPERALQALVLGEALERDVDRALQLLGGAVDDVGEDAALRGLVDIVGIVGVQDRDHRAGRLAHDLGDQLERVHRALAEPDQRDVGMLPRGDRPDLLDVDLTRDHVVPEPDHDLGEQLQPLPPLVRDQELADAGSWSRSRSRSRSWSQEPPDRAAARASARFPWRLPDRAAGQLDDEEPVGGSDHDTAVEVGRRDEELVGRPAVRLGDEGHPAPGSPASCIRSEGRRRDRCGRGSRHAAPRSERAGSTGAAHALRGRGLLLGGRGRTTLGAASICAPAPRDRHDWYLGHRPPGDRTDRRPRWLGRPHLLQPARLWEDISPGHMV